MIDILNWIANNGRTAMFIGIFIIIIIEEIGRAIANIRK